MVDLRDGVPSRAPARTPGRDRPRSAPAAVRRGVRAAADHGVPAGGCGVAPGRAAAPHAGGLLDAFDARLPFALTGGQVEVSEQIMAELARPHPMQRLLQGEVGSGKTVVALRAMLAVVDAGGQAALLAPTEVLAAQHFQTVTAMLGDLADGGTLGAPEHATGVVLITGSQSRGRRRRGRPLRAASGEAGIVDRHPRPAQRRRAVRRPRPGRGRRAAPVRGRAARRTQRQGRDPAARAGDDRDADPALGGHDRLRRPGDLDAARDPRRPGRGDHRGRRCPPSAGLGRAGLAADRRGGRARAGRRTWSARGSQRPSPIRASGRSELAPAVAVEDLYAELQSGPLAGLRVAMLHGQLPSEEKEAVMAPVRRR